jgi:flagellar hook-associated protein 2
MVDNYNKFRKKLQEHTAYDASTEKGGVLFGDSAALRLDTELSQLLSGRISGAGTIRSIAELGVDIKSDGTLELTEATLKARFAADPDAVEKFFTESTHGFAKRFNDAAEQLCGQDVSLLAQRFKALDKKIEENQAKIAFMTTRLTTQRERLLTSFYNMELAIGKMQNNLSAISSMELILGSSSSSSSSSSS